MLLFGYKTKTATIVSWFFLISIQSRNPLVLQGGDVLFRMIVFWAMFLPLGKVFSIDSKLKSKNPEKERNKDGWFTPKRVFCIGSIGILLQVFFLYWFAAMLKTGREWYPDGTSIYYALSIDQFTTNFGLFLLRFPEFLQFLTYFVLFYWYFGALLLFVPLFFGPARTIAVFVFILVQMGMGLTMRLGFFPLIAIVAMFPLIPSWFWDKMLKKLRITRPSKMNLQGTKSYFDFTKKKNIAATILGGFFIFYILMWNLQSVTSYSIPQDTRWFAYTTRVDQKWNMFSPRPLTDDGWYIIEAKLRNGDIIDLFNDGKEVTFEKPKLVANTYKNQRWRKYMMNLWKKTHKDYRLFLGKYLCRSWNREHKTNELLEEFDIIFMRETTKPNYEYSEPVKIVIWEHNCFE